MSTMVVVGAQWGDEGKGKVVDVLAEEAELVVRYAGGNNAGHTLVVDGKQWITHLVPSGCLYPGTLCVLGTGMVIDPDVLQVEVEAIQQLGRLQSDELRISLDAHVIFPYHRALDGLREDRALGGLGRIGTTRRGIGPAYEAKVARRGIRVRDLFDENRLVQLLELNRAHIEPELQRLGNHSESLDVDALHRKAQTWAAWLRPHVCDVGRLVYDAARAGRRILFEGAQGALLDIDHGTYPYVTSSSTIAGGCSTGVGIGPTYIDAVWGITKAYATRVGEGPFPTRQSGAVGEQLRAAGHEVGATTGRPRDCGWLDLPALRFAARINGLTGLCVTKLDVLAQMSEVFVCLGYRDGVDPGRDGFEGAVPEYCAVDGWSDPNLAAALRNARTIDALPPAARKYLDLIEEQTGVPIVLVSVGADRAETIRVARAF